LTLECLAAEQIEPVVVAQEVERDAAGEGSVPLEPNHGHVSIIAEDEKFQIHASFLKEPDVFGDDRELGGG